MYDTATFGLNNFELQSANYALVQYVHQDESGSSYTSLKPSAYQTSNSEKTLKNPQSKNKKKLSTLSGLFDFPKLDDAYYREKGF
jgi:hypothetical protein